MEIYGSVLVICQNTTMRVYGACIKRVFYVQKYIAYRAVCHNFLLVRDKLQGVPA